MDENKQWHSMTLIKKAAVALEKNKFSVFVANDAAAANEKILQIIALRDIVGFGGSQTLRQLNITEALQKRGQPLMLQLPGMNRDDVVELRRKMLRADAYLASPNAITLDGKLIYMDKIGNRAAAMAFGPHKVIAVAGYNKIVTDEEAARERIRTIAGPVNAKRLKLSTPCVHTGICEDCNSPDRICNMLMTLFKRPANTEYHVILLPEELGY